jgi:uncharacterized protein (DUF305 family)
VGRWNLQVIVASLALLAGCTTLADTDTDTDTDTDIGVAEASPAAESDSATTRSVEHDFLQMMIAHHQQAVQMIGWVDERTASDEVRWLTRPMGEVQQSEIELMRGWLDELPEVTAEEHDHHSHDMLDEPTLSAIRSADGEEFDRRFLAGMIVHHEGALDMVEQFFAEAAPGSDLVRFAKKLFDDQQVEIGRMRALLRDLDG